MMTSNVILAIEVVCHFLSLYSCYSSVCVFGNESNSTTFFHLVRYLFRLYFGLFVLLIVVGLLQVAVFCMIFFLLYRKVLTIKCFTLIIYLNVIFASTLVLKD